MKDRIEKIIKQVFHANGDDRMITLALPQGTSNSIAEMALWYMVSTEQANEKTRKAALRLIETYERSLVRAQEKLDTLAAREQIDRAGLN